VQKSNTEQISFVFLIIIGMQPSNNHNSRLCSISICEGKETSVNF